MSKFRTRTDIYLHFYSSSNNKLYQTLTDSFQSPTEHNRFSYISIGVLKKKKKKHIYVDNESRWDYFRGLTWRWHRLLRNSTHGSGIRESRLLAHSDAGVHHLRLSRGLVLGWWRSHAHPACHVLLLLHHLQKKWKKSQKLETNEIIKDENFL